MSGIYSTFQQKIKIYILKKRDFISYDIKDKNIYGFKESVAKREQNGLYILYIVTKEFDTSCLRNIHSHILLYLPGGVSHCAGYRGVTRRFRLAHA